jgi:cellulose synthase/poly-beta-1,6-N-acetylglucosamine synthase-like glycosyltransferase
MAALISLLLTVGAALVAIPVAVFLVEVVAAVALPRRSGAFFVGARDHGGPLAVLVPAHNESTGLLPTLADIKQQLQPNDRLLVVADNCTDDKAHIALAQGAEVIERHDAVRRGKGYALDLGVRHLGCDPPEIVIIIDADCRLAENALRALFNTCTATLRPVQSLNLMAPPADAQINHRVAEFAWRVKNSIRPLGLAALGLPCQLMGTGMAFPWSLIRDSDLAHGSIVEDLKLGLDLTAAGHPPLFCPTALVTSEFPATQEGADIQRQRWEQGHLLTIARTVPQLLGRAVTRCDLNLLALALDVLVPPLSLLVLVLVLTSAATGLGAALGLAIFPFILTASCFAGLAISIGITWHRYGRDILPVRSLFAIPSYVLGKIGLYRRIFSGKSAKWVRTDRAKN